MSDARTLPGRRSGGARQGIEILHSADAGEWLRVLAESVQHDFHHLPQYHRVAELRGEGKAHLFAYRDGPHLIALPLLLRPVDGGGSVDGGEGGEGVEGAAGVKGAAAVEGAATAEIGRWFDATSVYGYAGPVTSHASMPAGVVRRFQEALREALAERRVVSVFSRLHPLIPQRDILEGLGEWVPSGQTVSVDLTLPLDEQRARFRKKARRTIEKAREAGVVCVRDSDGRYFDAWVETYEETMRRVGASPAYFFGEDYFRVLFRELGPVLNLFVALVDDRVAAAGLYTICDGIVQAHLGSMRAEYMRLSPTRLLDDTVRVWAHEQGARVFHLGGGVGGHEDSLFQYKASFSDRRHEFATWRWVVEPDVYRELSAQMHPLRDPEAGQSAGDFFPAYRAPAEPPAPDLA